MNGTKLIQNLSILPWSSSRPRLFSSTMTVCKKKGGKAPETPVTSSRLPSSEGFNGTEMKKLLDGTLRTFEEKIKEARANNLSTDKFQNLDIDLGGGVLSPLKSVATIAARGNKINIVAFDPKQVKRIQTAIVSDLGMPAELSNSDKQTLSVNVPQQTETKKAATLKLIKEAYESLRNNNDNRSSIAYIRAKYINPLKKAAAKNSGVSKDDVKRQTQEIEQLVKTYGGKLQDLLKKASA